MNLSNYNKSVYLIFNLFRIYTLYRFTGIFFDKTYTKKHLEILIFITYYFINSWLYISYSNPLLNLIINVLLFFILTFIYKSKLFIKLISTVMIYSANMIIESIAYNVFHNVLVNLDGFISIVSNLLLFLLVLVLEKVFDGKSVHKINLMHWLAIFLIPISSIIIVITIFQANLDCISTIIIVSILLGINVMIFYLYDLIIKYYGDRYEKKLLKQQNNAYANQFEIIKTSQENIKMLRHDLKNHIYIMQNLLLNNKKQELLNYLEGTFKYIDIEKEYVKSGNVYIDSILNYKIYEAQKIGSEISVTVNIPKKTNIDAFDLSIILGNLMDNAIEALKNSEDKKLIIVIEFDRAVLYITILNTYNGKIQRKAGVLQSTKNDAVNHGIGFNSIHNAISKYNGSINIEYDSKTFCVSLLFYHSE